MSTKTEDEQTVILKPIEGLINDKSQDEGWTLVKDTPIVGVPRLGLFNFLEKMELSISTDEILKRIEKIDRCAGQQHAERLLSFQNIIHIEWTDKYLIFPGTIWFCSEAESYYIPCLVNSGTGWLLRWDVLVNDSWGDNDRFVICK